VGLKARFFHPRTLGVMHRGTVVKVHEDGNVSVRFDVDGKTWRTCPEFIKMEREKSDGRALDTTGLDWPGD